MKLNEVIGQLLLPHGPSDRRANPDGRPGGPNPLEEAAKTGNTGAMALLVKYGARVDTDALSILMGNPGLDDLNDRWGIRDAQRDLIKAGARLTRHAATDGVHPLGMAQLEWRKAGEQSTAVGQTRRQDIIDSLSPTAKPIILASLTAKGAARVGALTAWSREAALTIMTIAKRSEIGNHDNVAWVFRDVPVLPREMWQSIVDSLPHNALGRREGFRMSNDPGGPVIRAIDGGYERRERERRDMLAEIQQLRQKLDRAEEAAKV